MASNKPEQSMHIISDVITKIGFFIISVEEQETSDSLHNILKKYQTQRRKILNL